VTPKATKSEPFQDVHTRIQHGHQPWFSRLNKWAPNQKELFLIKKKRSQKSREN